MGQVLLPNIFDFLAQLDPFNRLPSQQLTDIANQVQVSYLAKGESITFSAQCEQRFLYIIRTGAIEQRMPDGSLRARLGAEDQFGFTFLNNLHNAEDGYQATAIEDSLLYQIPHPTLQRLLTRHPEFAQDFASQAQQRLYSAVHQVCREEEKGLFYRQVGEIASENIAVVDASMSIKQVAHIMCHQQISSCAVVKQGDAIVGLITDRDMTKRVVAANLDTQLPIAKVMTPDPKLINAQDKVLQAISLMMNYNIRCLPVMDNHQVVGLLTTSHLVHNHRTQALFLIEKIKYANTLDALVSLTPERQAIFESLVESGVNANMLGRVMTLIMDAINRRLIQLAQEQLGPAPGEFAWIVAGSHARNEVHLLSDQDSAIVYADNIPAHEQLYFTHLAMQVCNGLDACGYPLCKGKYMAATPKWCQPLSVWKAYYHKWVTNPEYNKLLNISVFLEVRALHGQTRLVDEMQQHLHLCIQKSQRFLASLTRDAVNTAPPLGIFNNLVLEKNGENKKTLNIKRYALNLIIDLARIYSLAVKASQHSTEERFYLAFLGGALSEDSYKNIVEAYRFISQVRFTHQLDALKQGLEPNNHIDPNRFSSFERKHLKDAFKIINELQDVAKLKFIKA